MSKIILNLAVSLDGYIARLDNSVDFLGNTFSKEQEDDFNAFLNTVDVIVMGSTSYDKMIELGEQQFQNKLIYVLTSQEYADEENTIFTDQEIDELVIDLKAQSKKNIWLFGGAKTIQQFIEIGEVDEFIITYTPSIIGTGIPLFLFSKNEIKLELLSSKRIDQNVTLHYKKIEA
jgi:dihydrofolate reductase